MIDIHAHVLPLDDGPKTYLQSIEMCREAEKQGITKIICTPHVLVPGFGVDKKKIEKSISHLRKLLKQAKIKVELVQGAENMYDQNIPIARTGYMLVEFPLSEMPLCAEARLKELLKKYYVIIAHPERYAKIRKNPSLLEKFVKMGCYAQVNASSFFSWRKKKYVKMFLKQKLVHFIGSDMHSKREARLFPLAVECAKKYMPDAEKLVTKNPEKMLRGRKL
jgi:protein-tyrosine phosphatase